jgi:hypothetical protein
VNSSLRLISLALFAGLLVTITALIPSPCHLTGCCCVDTNINHVVTSQKF